MQQLLLFEELQPKENACKIQLLQEKYDKLRKSQHARITGLQKKIDELESRLKLLEAHICKGGSSMNSGSENFSRTETLWLF